MNSLIIIFSFFALTHAIKESSLFDKPRIWLIGLHPFFYELLSCYFCTGFHSGWIIYLIANPYWRFGDMIIWGLASAGVSLLFNNVSDRLLR